MHGFLAPSCVLMCSSHSFDVLFAILEPPASTTTSPAHKFDEFNRGLKHICTSFSFKPSISSSSDLSTIQIQVDLILGAALSTSSPSTIQIDLTCFRGRILTFGSVSFKGCLTSRFPYSMPTFKMNHFKHLSHKLSFIQAQCVSWSSIDNKYILTFGLVQGLFDLAFLVFDDLQDSTPKRTTTSRTFVPSVFPFKLSISGPSTIQIDLHLGAQCVSRSSIEPNKVLLEVEELFQLDSGAAELKQAFDSPGRSIRSTNHPSTQPRFRGSLELVHLGHIRFEYGFDLSLERPLQLTTLSIVKLCSLDPGLVDAQGTGTRSSTLPLRDTDTESIAVCIQLFASRRGAGVPRIAKLSSLDPRPKWSFDSTDASVPRGLLSSSSTNITLDNIDVLEIEIGQLESTVNPQFNQDCQCLSTTSA
ncbi:hypothetical protein C8R46DRAFT_1037389 [Mycena filopes]|nr:hypothetical protein C8R46DRAFT_1037389 [Mycena filopes]